MTQLNISGFILAILFVSLIISKKGKYIRDYLLAFFISILGNYQATHVKTWFLVI